MLPTDSFSFYVKIYAMLRRIESEEAGGLNGFSPFMPGTVPMMTRLRRLAFFKNEGEALRKENALKACVYGDFERLGKEIGAVPQAELLSLEFKNCIVFLLKKQFADLIDAEELDACDPSMSTWS